jgi:hypothetical protein
MRFFRRSAWYPLFDQKRNEEILEILKVVPVDEKIRRCISNWLRYGKRTNNNNSNKNRMPKNAEL